MCLWASVGVCMRGLVCAPGCVYTFSFGHAFGFLLVQWSLCMLEFVCIGPMFHLY